MPNVNPLVLGDFGVLLLVVFALLGLIMGSFSSAMIHRLPSGVGVFSPGQRSACPYCNHTLGVRDLIPLFSWLFSRGRCRYCSASIPALYPFFGAKRRTARHLDLYFLPGEGYDAEFYRLGDVTVPFGAAHD